MICISSSEVVKISQTKVSEHEKKRAEYYLPEDTDTLKKLEALYKVSPVISFTWKAEDRWPVEWVSENISQFGYTSEEFMTGKLDYADIIHPEDYEKINLEVKRLLKKGKTSYFTLSYRILTKSGEVRYVTERSLIRRDNYGNMASHQGIIIDNTEKEKAESALKDIEKKYHVIFEKSPIGILYFDENSTIINCNGLCSKIFAEPISKILNLNLLKYLEEGPLKAAVDIVFLGETGHFEGEYTFPNGKKSFLKAEFFPLISDEGYLIGGVGLVQDRSEFQGFEKRIRLNEERLEALLELHQRANSTISEIVEFVIEKAVRLTNSEKGFIGLLKDGDKLELHEWPTEEKQPEKKAKISPVNTAGMWGEAIREREPIINNRFSGQGLTKGIKTELDSKINRYINVPVMDGDQVVAVAAVVNKSEDYDNTDVRQLTLLFDGMWKLIQREFADEQIIETRRMLKMMESVINDSPAIVFMWSPEKDWPVKFVSKNIERFGYAVDDFLSGKMIYGDIIHPADLEKVRSEVARCYKEGYSDFSQEYRILTKSGEVRWVDERTLIHHNQNGDIDFLEGIIVDITERKQASNFFQANNKSDSILGSVDNLEEIFEKILDFALQIKAIDCGAIYLVNDSDGDFELVAHRGLSENFVHSIRHFGSNTIQARLFTTGYPVYKYFSEISTMIKEDLDYEGLQAMGFIPVYHGEKLVAAMILGSHKELEIPANSRNVIDTIADQLGVMLNRFREGTLFKHENNRLQDLFDTMDDLIFIMNMDGLIIDTNYAVQKYLKYSKKELSKMDFLELFPPGKEEEVLENIDIDNIVLGKSSRCYVPLMTKDRKFLSADTKFFIGKCEGREVLIGVSRLSSNEVVNKAL